MSVEVDERADTFHGARRYLSNQPRRYTESVQAAKDYVEKIGERTDWARRKPYDPTPGNPQFYQHIFELTSLLQAMHVRPNGRILEVGSGSGWVTEILMCLNFQVDALEPAPGFVSIAQDRIRACIAQRGLTDPPAVNFYCATLEECDLPENSYDAILFYAALHHIFDENLGLLRCFRLLREGGVLGVHEGAWLPGNREIEGKLDAEMAQYGTLENPYTIEYLDFLLRKHGFTEIVRYHQVNGMFPVAMGHLTLEQAAQMPARSSNILTTIKPSRSGPTTLDYDALTRAQIQVLHTTLDEAARIVRLRVKLSNVGHTTWLCKAERAGVVTLALRQGALGTPEVREARPRAALPRDVRPGEDLEIEAEYQLPEGYRTGTWYVDLVNEHYYWFSLRGTVPAEITFA